MISKTANKKVLPTFELMLRGLVQSRSLCRRLKLQHECNSREIIVNVFGTRLKNRNGDYIVQNTNTKNRQPYFS